MPSKNKTKKHPEHTKEEGECLEPLDRPLADVLGSSYEGILRGNARNATWKQILQYNGWTIPGEPVPVPSSIFNDDEIDSIRQAITAKTGRGYSPASRMMLGPWPSAGCACSSCYP